MTPEEKAKAYVKSISEGTNIQKVIKQKTIKSSSIKEIGRLHQEWLNKKEYLEILFINSVTESNSSYSAIDSITCGLIITYTKLEDKFDSEQESVH